MPDKPRVVTYARQSLTRGPDDESLSIEVQTRACREYAARQGWELVQTFEDPDQKGWKQHRPAFDAMLGWLRDGRADIAVVFKLSRFARSLMHQETIIGEIADAGGELASVTEPYISTSPMVRQILGAVNEQYRRDQGDFLKAAYAGRARRGYHHGYAPIGYRLEDGRLVMDDTTAGIVRQMFAWALEGHGSPEITHRLNAQGIRTATGRPWSQRTTLRVLRNAAYVGDVVLHGEVVACDAHPALVDRPTFEGVQANLDRRRGLRRKVSPSWVDGFVYHACGTRMYCASWRVGQDHRWRFRCGNTVASKRHHAERCQVGQASIFADRAETIMCEQLVTTLPTLVSPDEAIARIEAAHAQSSGKRQRERQRLEQRIVRLSDQRDKLLDMALRGRVDDDVYATRDMALKQQITDIRNELATIPAPVDAQAIGTLHAMLTGMVDDIEALVAVSPDALPPLLHQMDARLVVGPDTCRLDFGSRVAPFFGR